jgi:hypothetical protein
LRGKVDHLHLHYIILFSFVRHPEIHLLLCYSKLVFFIK